MDGQMVLLKSVLCKLLKSVLYTLPTYTLPIKVVPTMYYHIKDRK